MGHLAVWPSPSTHKEFQYQRFQFQGLAYTGLNVLESSHAFQSEWGEIQSYLSPDFQVKQRMLYIKQNKMAKQNGKTNGKTKWQMIAE